MKTKVIIAAVFLSFFVLFSFACYKVYKKVSGFVSGVQKPFDNIEETKEKSKANMKEIGTEHYIMGGKYYKVRRFSPDIETDDKDLIEYNRYLNDLIEIALQKARKFEKYIPEEYKEYTPEKAEKVRKELDAKSKETLEKLPDEWKDFAKNMQIIGESLDQGLPDDEDKALAAFYGSLLSLEKSKNNDSEDSFLRREAYETMSKYYSEKYFKYLHLSVYGSKSPLAQIMLKAHKENGVPLTPEEWRNRIIVPGVKETVKMEPSGFLVPDILYKKLKKAELPFDIYDNNITVKTQANKNVPAMKYMEYYYSEGNMEENIGWELFFFRFDGDFTLFNTYADYSNYFYILKVIANTVKKHSGISYFDITTEETPEELYGPDGERKISIRYLGKQRTGQKTFDVGGWAVSEGNKVWVYLTKANFIDITNEDLNENSAKTSKEKPIMAKWFYADDTDLVIGIEGMCEFTPVYLLQD